MRKTLKELLSHRLTPERIRWVRKIFRETRIEFGRTIGVDQSTVKSWESGHRTPNGPALKLLNIFEIEAQSVYNEREELLQRSLDKVGL